MSLDTYFSVSEVADYLSLGSEASRQWIQAYEKLMRTSFREGSKGRRVPLGVVEEIRQARELLAAEGADSRESALEMILAGGAPEGKSDRVGEALARFDEKVDFVSDRFGAAAWDLKEHLQAGVQEAVKDIKTVVVPGFEKRLRKMAADTARELERQTAATANWSRQNQDIFLEQQAALLNRDHDQALRLMQIMEGAEAATLRVRQLAHLRFWSTGLWFLLMGSGIGVLGTLGVQAAGWKMMLWAIGLGSLLCILVLFIIWLIAYVFFR